MSNLSTMPNKLRLALILMAVGVLFKAVEVFSADGGTQGYVVLAIQVAIVVGLYRGHESIRAAVRVLSLLGALVGVFAVISALGVLAVGALAYMAIVVGALTVAISLYVFWALGQEDVIAWMGSRSLANLD
ncbi:MAG: hypothetical protein H6713_13185 [Myxococcales bacterium]|nr:hypothetical protein [Myxococcales bacterium]MCB9750935.1 hypothetical protein [Myxococcales bacterium]